MYNQMYMEITYTINGYRFQCSPAIDISQSLDNLVTQLDNLHATETTHLKLKIAKLESENQQLKLSSNKSRLRKWLERRIEK